MKKLKDNSKEPHGGWKYEQPETGMVFRNMIRAKLVIDVKNHRMQKGIEVGNVEADIEDFICRNQRPGVCVEGEVTAVKKSGFNVNDVRSFGESVAHILKSGRVVAPSEADRRARICADCPMNDTLAGCSACSGIATFIFSLLGSRKTASDKHLKSCGACGCPLKAKVWITKGDLEQKQQIQAAMDIYPSHCWMKQPPQG